MAKYVLKCAVCGGYDFDYIGSSGYDRYECTECGNTIFMPDTDEGILECE